MTNITAQQVKELRETTGAAMMDCKNALVATDGDMQLAIEALRKSGKAKADKKADRIAAEGVIAAVRSTDSKDAVLLDLNCETDFVARGDQFKAFAEAAANVALAHRTNDVAQLATLSLGNETVDEGRRTLTATLGENIQIRRIAFLSSTGSVGAYIHGGRIGVLASLSINDEALAKDIAMHIAASNPLVIDPSEVPAELIAKEREIYAAQGANSGKPPEIQEKMLDGRIKKYLDEVSLMGQPFVKDPDITVGALLKKHQAQVLQFIRFSVGEGIEKKADNFVEEVMAQARGA